MKHIDFDIHEVTEVIKTTKASKKFIMGYDSPTILLVHDAGVYLLGNCGKKKGKRTVAYAAGLSPEDDWFDAAGDFFGTNDDGDMYEMDWCNDHTLKYFRNVIDHGGTHVRFTRKSNGNLKMSPKRLS